MFPSRPQGLRVTLHVGPFLTAESEYGLSGYVEDQMTQKAVKFAILALQHLDTLDRIKKCLDRKVKKLGLLFSEERRHPFS